MRSLSPAVAALAAILLVASVPAGADEIGVASAVKNQVTGTIGGTTAPLNAGNSVFQDQLVATGADSAAQLLFLDETSFDIGPNSEVTLDRFVYDPVTRTGDVVLQTGRGVFRFVTGSADPTSYSISTPTVTIGFRGSVADIIGSPPSGTPITIICVEATVIVVVDGVEYVLDTPGDAVTISDDGTVQGPFTWNGEYYEVVEGFAFPLYADGFLGEPRRVDLPDGKIHVIDELDSEFEEEIECEGEGCGGGEIVG